jgi:SAM-dependent methyltransferase
MMTALQVAALNRFFPHEPQYMNGAVYANKSKLKTLLGESILEELSGKDVLDFGCGAGAESIEIASVARSVVGLDIRPQMFPKSHPDNCQFATATLQRFAAIVSIDSFEHFSDPAGMLRLMKARLEPNGYILASFGPTWYHPLGGHLFSVFPWAHLVFSESALCQWRKRIRSDGATKFCEVEGGLNQMTIRQFEKIVRAEGMKFQSFECVPIRKLAPIHNRLTREFTSAIVRCKLTTGHGQSQQ